jgi:hypothetical protein
MNWANESEPTTTPGNARAKPGWYELVLFGSVLLIATLLYLFTNLSMAAAILPCLHGGWHTFRTGLWLLQVDPCRPHARICFAFYVATACWKAAAAAFMAIILFIVAAANFGFQPNMDEIAATMLVMFGGIVLNTLLGVVAIYAALRHKIRVWVHPHLRTAVHGDLRLTDRLGPLQIGFNHAIFVVATALAFPLVVVAALSIAIFTVGMNRNQVETVPVMVFEFVLLFGGPIALIPCYAWLSSRIIARSPLECWSAVLETEVAPSKVP